MPKISFPKDKYDDYSRRLTIPVDKEILKAMEVGEEVTIVCKGTVKSLSEREYTEYPCCGPSSKKEKEKKVTKRELDIVLTTVEFPDAYGEDDGVDEDLLDA